MFIFLAICTEGYLFIYEEFSVLNLLYGCLDIILLVESFLYLITGRKKSSAGYYKVFSMVYAIRIFIGAIFAGTLFSTYQLPNQSQVAQVISNALAIIPLAPAVMLATCKDLGRKNHSL